MDQLTLEAIYRCAYARDVAPFPFQRAVANSPLADILIAPTGLGKTAAVTLGWAWRRLQAPATTPRRLVWCLPMRTLVEQVAEEAKNWMQHLSRLFADEQSTPRVHVIMGGAVDNDWRLRVEDPAIIVGTQDMLLSRALMRGYALGRFGWPIDFGLLHNDALWVYDEVQLMGAGLATSAQLEAFRRRDPHRQGLARSLWVSATLDPEWLQTAEFRREISKPVVLRWNDGSPPEPATLSARLDAVKHLRKAKARIDSGALKNPDAYAKSLATEVAATHRSGTTTLVILNTVSRAQAVYRAIGGMLAASTTRLLLHSRYRAAERRALEENLRRGVAEDRVVVATQAVEAGVDMTSAVLFTELAPWSALVQRFGRCNRAGERNGVGGAEIRWIDVETDDNHAARPYEAGELSAARAILATLEKAHPRNLPPPSAPPPPNQVIRPKDFEELFDTDADLSGHDIDISPYIRDGDDMSVSLFWRAMGDEGEDGRIVSERPRRDELCPASLGKALQDWLTRDGARVYIEDPLADGKKNWIRLERSGRRLRPGLTLLVNVGMGGYDRELGFVGAAGMTAVEPVSEDKAGQMPPEDDGTGTTTGSDPLSFDGRLAVPLELHQDDVAAYARRFAEAARLPDAEATALIRACFWHDLGKAYGPFQNILGRTDGEPLLAKSGTRTAPVDAERPRKYFRHELASALGFLQQHDGEPDADLVAFLIAAHHGRVRMGLRALPEERADKPGLRIARGVQDGDCLPAVRCGDEVSDEVTLALGLMEMGENEHGRPSWAARTQSLLAAYGPFRLAYLEALIRMSDWRASDPRENLVARDA